ncbi:MAG: pilus assembly protein [Propionibacteriaceae bacterium]|jgi:hypothetical protein|nr:pilus assembly protein [Propionibacteriaceae bacterium]
MASSERGSVTLEAAIVTPALLLLFLLVVFAGRVTMASQAVDQAAWDAARAVSLARTETAAQADGRGIGEASLANQGVYCDPLDIVIDASALSRPPAAPDLAAVRVEVTCRVDMSDLSGLGVPGSVVFTASADSVADRFRSGP